MKRVILFAAAASSAVMGMDKLSNITTNINDANLTWRGPLCTYYISAVKDYSDFTILGLFDEKNQPQNDNVMSFGQVRSSTQQADANYSAVITSNNASDTNRTFVLNAGAIKGGIQYFVGSFACERTLAFYSAGIDVTKEINATLSNRTDHYQLNFPLPATNVAISSDYNGSNISMNLMRPSTSVSYFTQADRTKLTIPSLEAGTPYNEYQLYVYYSYITSTSMSATRSCNEYVAAKIQKADSWHLLAATIDGCTISGLKALGATAVYPFDASANNYSANDTIPKGYGFWIKSSKVGATSTSTQTSTTTMPCTDTPMSRRVAGKWNLLGVTAPNCTISDMKAKGASAVWLYDALIGSYAATPDAIPAFTGFWLK